MGRIYENDTHHAMRGIVLFYMAITAIAGFVLAVLLGLVTSPAQAAATVASQPDGWTINAILFWLVITDATIILTLGLVCAVLILLGYKFGDAWWERVFNATLTLVLTSLGGGALLWGAGYLFGA